MGVAVEIGLRVHELRLIAIARGGHLVDLGLVGPRIDLREQVAGMYGLPFGEVDADDLSLDLAAHDDGVIGDDGADAGQIDRHVVLSDRSATTGTAGGVGAAATFAKGWAYIKYKPPAASTAVRTATDRTTFLLMVVLAQNEEFHLAASGRRH